VFIFACAAAQARSLEGTLLDEHELLSFQSLVIYKMVKYRNRCSVSYVKKAMLNIIY